MAYPKGNPGEDYMSDTPDATESPMDEHDESQPHENQDEQTAVLPKYILAGKEFKPGEEVVLKIVRIHDDEVEVAYAPAKGGDDYSEPKPSDPEMASLMED